MPLSPVVVPLYPTVPQAPGVPLLIRGLNQATSVVVEVTSDLVKLQSFLSGPQWGLFDSYGRLALQPDSIASVEFKREWRVATYPIENGGFQSYNKVEIPYDVRLMFMIGQDEAARYAFLAACDGICGSINLYSAVTPEATYPTLSPYSYDYKRTRENGCTLLKVTVDFLKIRQSAVSSYSNTQQPSGANPAANGSVQPQATLLSAADFTKSFH